MLLLIKRNMCDILVLDKTDFRTRNITWDKKDMIY